MNELKKPTSLLAGTNIIFSVGSFIYFCKRFEQLLLENVEINKTLLKMKKDLAENNNNDKQQDELLKNMHKEFKMIKENMGKIDEYKLEDEIKTIMDTLEANDIPIKSSKKNRKSKKYRGSSSESLEYDDLPKRRTLTPHKKKSIKEESDDAEEELINMMRLKRNA